MILLGHRMEGSESVAQQQTHIGDCCALESPHGWDGSSAFQESLGSQATSQSL